MAQGTTGFAMRLNAGERLVGGWITMASPIGAEIMGLAGFDMLMIDQEHGPGDSLAGDPTAAGDCRRRYDGQPSCESSIATHSLSSGRSIPASTG